MSFIAGLRVSAKLFLTSSKETAASCGLYFLSCCLFHLSRQESHNNDHYFRVLGCRCGLVNNILWTFIVSRLALGNWFSGRTICWRVLACVATLAAGYGRRETGRRLDGHRIHRHDFANLNLQEPIEKYWAQGRSFLLFMIGMAALFAVAAAPLIESTLPGIGIPVSIGGILLIVMGLLQLGITTQGLRVILGLLTTLSGFEILYAAMEGSVWWPPYWS